MARRLFEEHSETGKHPGQPLAFKPNETTFEGDAVARRLFEEPWWSSHLGHEAGNWWMRTLQLELTHDVPLRARQGFVNAMSDLMANLGHQLQMYLPELMSVLLRFAQASSHTLQAQVHHQSLTSCLLSFKPQHVTSHEQPLASMQKSCLVRRRQNLAFAFGCSLEVILQKKPGMHQWKQNLA